MTTHRITHHIPIFTMSDDYRPPATLVQHPSAPVQFDPRDPAVLERHEPEPPANLMAIHPNALAGGRADRMAILQELLRLGDGKGLAVALARYHREDPDGFPFA